MRIDEKSSPQDSTSSKEQRKYIGQEFDASTGLSYLNARYYDGNRGQFLSQDPVFWSQNQNLPDPQSLNSYSYAGNNPINWSDPTGLFTKDSPANIVRNLMESVFNLTASISSLVNNLVRNPVESIQSVGQRINSVIAHPGASVRGIAAGTIQDAKSTVSGILSGDDATQERGISQAILFAGSLIAPQGRAARIADDALRAGDKVAGLRVTNHAAHGFADRNMQPEQVVTALKDGVKYLDTRTGNLLHVVGERAKDGYTVVTDHAQEVLVSVENFVRNLAPKNSPNRFKKLD